MTINQRNKRKQFFTDAFQKMFRSVGFDEFDETFINQPSWYTMREWSQEEEKVFTDWFVCEFSSRFKKSKKYATEECRWFLLNYGWKIKDYTVKIK